MMAWTGSVRPAVVKASGLLGSLRYSGQRRRPQSPHRRDARGGTMAPGGARDSVKVPRRPAGMEHGIAERMTTRAIPWGSAQKQECRIEFDFPILGCIRRCRPSAGGSGHSILRCTELVDREHSLARLLWPPVRSHCCTIRAISRPIRRAFARMAGSIRMQRHGLASPLPRQEKRTRPLQHVRDAESDLARNQWGAHAVHYRGEPYVVAGDIGA